MNTIEKTLRLLTLLNSKTGILTAKEIGEVIGVKDRQVRNYVKAIVDAGFGIDAQTGQGGGYYGLSPTTQVNQNIVKEEIIALKKSVDLICTDELIEDCDHLQTLYEKLASLYKNSDRIKHTFSYQPLFIHKHALEEKEIIKKISESIMGFYKLNIEYYSNRQRKLTERIIHPYKVFTSQGATYVDAYCEFAGEVRTFKVIRIKKATVLHDHKFAVDFEIEDSMKSKYGVFIEKQCRLIADFEYPFNEFIQEVIIGENQETERIDDNVTRITVDVMNITELEKWLLGFGSKVTIIEPQVLIDQITEESRKILKKYGVN